MSEIYDRLMAGDSGQDPFDRHVFACILAKGATETNRPWTEAVGLGRKQLTALLQRYFPAALSLADGVTETTGSDALEEPDLRRLLIDNATHPGSDESRWLAAMVARRSLLPNHLWQDLGVTQRSDLSGLLTRHFAPLAALNVNDMKWKKFFYRQLCEREGVLICKSPICDSCSDYSICFGQEES